MHGTKMIMRLVTVYEIINPSDLIGYVTFLSLGQPIAL